MPEKPTDRPTSTAAVLTMIRTAGLRLLLVSAVIAALASGVGYLVAGVPGVWAALIGAGLSLAFTGATVGCLYLVVGRSAELLQIVMLGSWLVKMVLVFVLLSWLQHQTFYHRGVLFATLVVVVVAALVVETITVLKARIPYVEPGAGGQ
ncbi:hypothetical protein [Ruania albidiflava]|uniref:hypothetical protein n=1 Tax=Ruania albidiflava TaxID=366586 RepID=UPI00040232BB|nr:hypothetical protein [Ruania albidiflava]TMZ59003.1 hypothetical protein EMG21_30165 [Klebsiella pneumoniae]